MPYTKLEKHLSEAKILERLGELSPIVLEVQEMWNVTGDSVYYKRIDSKEWHGPAKVLSQDGQQVFVKNGSNYIQVHPCRLQLINENPEIPKTPTTEA